MMDRDYRESADRYLFFLAMACAISSLFIGPGAILVWIVTAVCLGLFGRSSHKPNNDHTNRDAPRCEQKRRR